MPTGHVLPVISICLLPVMGVAIMCLQWTGVEVNTWSRLSTSQDQVVETSRSRNNYNVESDKLHSWTSKVPWWQREEESPFRKGNQGRLSGGGEFEPDP